MTPNEKVLEHIECSHAALDAANTELTKAATKQAATEALIPDAVKALILHNKIDAADQEKAAAMLRDPEQALKILIKAADPANTTGPAPIGQSGTAGAGQRKQASYVGERSAIERDSDRVFREKLLG